MQKDEEKKAPIDTKNSADTTIYREKIVSEIAPEIESAASDHGENILVIEA